MGSAKKAAEGFVNDAVSVTTAGVYNPATGSVNVGSGQARTYTDGVTGANTQASFAPEMPKAPVAEDPAAQAARAKAEADAKIMKDLGEKGRGLSSTILGGSTSQDSGILQKKKLLGE